MPLKIIWALLDIVAIFVLGSGIYLWLAKRRARAAGAADDDVTAGDPVDAATDTEGDVGLRGPAPALLTREAAR